MFTKQRVVLSPGVRNLRALRMDAAHGTPTVWEKIAAAFGGGDPTTRAEILAGEQRDLSKAEQELLDLAQPILHQDVAELEAGVVTWATGFFGQLQTVHSIGQASADAKLALKTEGGALLTTVEGMAEGAWQALVALVLVKLGKVVPPGAPSA